MADTMEDLKKMKVPELKQALKDRELPISGTKPELIKRLCAAMGTEVDNDGGEEDIDDDILNDDPSDTTAPTSVATKSPIKAPDAPSVTPAVTKPKPEPITAPASQLTEKKDSNNVKESDTETAKPAAVEKLTDEERLKMRAQKFGAVSADVKKQMRAERFGVGDKTTDSTSSLSNPVIKTNLSPEETDRLKKRAERFGSVTSTTLAKVDEDERKRKRAERFGLPSPLPSSGKSTISVNSSQDPDLEAKKLKRAERFGIKT